MIEKLAKKKQKKVNITQVLQTIYFEVISIEEILKSKYFSIYCWIKILKDFFLYLWDFQEKSEEKFDKLSENVNEVVKKLLSEFLTFFTIELIYNCELSNSPCDYDLLDFECDIPPK